MLFPAERSGAESQNISEQDIPPLRHDISICWFYSL